MKSRSLKFKIFLIVIAVCCIFCIALISLYTPVIFQRGNPIPYLIASTKLNTETPYAQVKQTGSETVYITKRGVGEELLQLFAENTGAELQEQLGGTYIFSDGESEWMIESEIYWRNYTVWEIPTFINNAGEYYDLQELDRPTLMRLIQKIEISEKYTVDDHEERDIHIYYNFVGYIEV